MKKIISDIIKYFLKEYPHKEELSASRLTKMVYLMDWKSSIDCGCQVTDTKWYFDHYGPYVGDFVSLAKEDEDIDVETTSTMYGNKKQLFKLSNSFSGHVDLSENQKKIADFVINATKKKNYESFIQLVYSTYPIMSNERYSELDLVSLANEYKNLISNSSKQQSSAS